MVGLDLTLLKQIISIQECGKALFGGLPKVEIKNKLPKKYKKQRRGK